KAIHWSGFLAAHFQRGSSRVRELRRPTAPSGWIPGVFARPALTCPVNAERPTRNAWAVLVQLQSAEVVYQRLATCAVISPSRTRASAPIPGAFGSSRSLVQIARALAVSPATWY